MQLSKSNLAFLSALQKNNNREWFELNKPEFSKAQDEFKSFHKALETMMSEHDQIGKSKIFRIYRDVRFSKDKTPYKSYWSASFQRDTHYLRGGYYYMITPGGSMAAGGFFNPEPQDLLHIRKQLSQDPETLRNILADSSFISIFEGLQGEQVKTAPKGFDKEDPAIDLIKYKNFYVEHSYTDEEVLSKDFIVKLNDTFKALRPYFDFMSEILTTDLNGEAIQPT